MMKRLVTILLVSGVFPSVLVMGEGAESAKGASSSAKILRLDDIISTTLEHHPALQGERQERTAADADLLSAQGAFDPSIKGDALSYVTGGYTGNYGSAYVEQPLEFYGSKVFAGYRLGRGVFPTYDNYYETNNGGEVGAGLEVPLLRDGPIDRRRTNIGKSVAGQDLADSQVDQRKIELTRAAALTYWDWTAARNKVRVYRKLLQVADERDRQISERVLRGDLPDFDRVDNQRAVLQRRSQLLAAERAVSNAEYNLALFYRDSEGRPRSVQKFRELGRIPLPLHIDDMSLDGAVEEATQARPEFKNIKAQTKQNELELQLAKNQILPRLDARVFSGNDLGSGESRREEPEVKGGLRIEIPLATRTQQGRIDFYEAKQKKIGFSEQFLKERIRADIQDARNALEIARGRLQVTTKEVTAARDLAKGELKRFELGDSNLIFVNLREQNAADAEVREIEALQDYQKAFVMYEATVGRIHKTHGSTTKAP
jgi:outer membrane protein TolC